MLEGHNLLGRNDVPPYIQALDVTFLEGVGQRLDVVHDNQVVRNVEVFQSVVLLPDHLAKFLSRLS